MRDFVASIQAEYVRYKDLADKALQQVDDAELSRPGPNGNNSLAVICWHVSGNLKSRFTDFLTTDGEKPWRHREEEFDDRAVSRDELTAKWEEGWTVVSSALEALTDADLQRTVTIRGQALRVHEALHRSLAHTASHVGQIIYLAKSLRGAAFTSLSIPRGQSAAYNANPGKERPATPK
jgi:hypothetical protein